jgi:bacterioferritin-associated ferredoxin
MIACSCEVVAEREVRAAAAAGACTVEEVGFACRAGTGCGACHRSIDRILREAAVELRPVETAGDACVAA